MGYKYFEGNWSEQRAMAKLQWDRLSYAELEQSRGKMEELADLLQDRYGIDQEEALAQVEDFFSRY